MCPASQQLSPEARLQGVAEFHSAEDSSLSCIRTWPPWVAFGQGFPGAGMYSADVTTEYPRNLKGLEILAGFKGLVYMVNQRKCSLTRQITVT